MSGWCLMIESMKGDVFYGLHYYYRTVDEEI